MLRRLLGSLGGGRRPLVSVVIPAYHSAQTIEATLKSLIGQTEPRWEALVVDDGSPDESASIAERFAYFDGRFRVLRRPHAGGCAARNAGVAAAAGRYLLFLDADDWMDRDGLLRLTGACRRGRWAAAHGGFRYSRPDGTLTERTGGYAGPALFDALAAANVLAVPSSLLIAREVLAEVGGFDESVAYAADWDMWARVARGRWRVGRVPGCVTYYRMRPASMGRDARRVLRDAAAVLDRIHAPDPRVRRPHPGRAAGADRRRLAARLAHFAVYSAGLCVALGDDAGAAESLEAVPEWPRLDAGATAGFLFYAACFARCEGPEAAGQFWPEVEPRARALLADLERRSDTAGLADGALAWVDAFRAGLSSPAGPPGCGGGGDVDGSGPGRGA